MTTDNRSWGTPGCKACAEGIDLWVFDAPGVGWVVTCFRCMCKINSDVLIIGCDVEELRRSGENRHILSTQEGQEVIA